MKTSNRKQHENHDETSDLSSYHDPISKNETRETEFKKNILLTPFLLSIPVIMILFSLISDTNAEPSYALSDEPIHTELWINSNSQHQKTTVMKSDSSLSIKTAGLPTRK